MPSAWDVVDEKVADPWGVVDEKPLANPAMLPLPKAGQPPAVNMQEQAGPLSSMWHSFTSAVNPVPAFKEYLNRPNENRKLSGAMEAIGKAQEQKRELTPEENDAVETGMNAQVNNPMAYTPGPFTEPAVQAAQQVATGDPAGAVGTLAGGYALPAAIPGIVKGARKIASAVGGTGEAVATRSLGATTGAGNVPMSEALNNPTPALVKRMRQPDEMAVVNDFKDAVQNVKESRGAEYRQALEKVGNEAPPDITPEDVQDKAFQQLGEFNIKVRRVPPRPEVPELPHTITPEQLKQYQIAEAAQKSWDEAFEGRQPGDLLDLDFSKSTIHNPADQARVKGIVSDVLNWGKDANDFTVLGLDTLKRRIRDFYSDSSQARALVKRMDATVTDSLNTVPGYQDMTKGYAEASDFLDQLGEFSLDAKNPGTAIRKLTYALKQNNQYRQVLTEALDQYTDKDLMGQLAGQHLSNWTPRGLAAFGAGGALLWKLMSGTITPHAVVALSVTSPRLMGELMLAMSKVKPAIGAAGDAAQAIAQKSVPAAAAFQASKPPMLPVEKPPALSANEADKVFPREHLPELAQQRGVTIDELKRELETLGYQIK
ncbi:MAG TPA: hypothetical protein VNL17_14400 [Verrucomicrobiae bacterium]|nr:hypothetical protein [Verrucomicrobiae bacterium]